MKVDLDDGFPGVYAQTDRFRCGMPRSFSVTDAHVTYLRSEGAYERRLSLWRFDLATGIEHCLVEADALVADDGDLPDAERARRERLRESGSGITSYSMNASGSRIAFAVAGSLWLWDEFGLRSVETPGPVFDPRLDPAGECIACVVGVALLVLDFVDGTERARVTRAGCSVGLPDFIASEEFSRYQGHWWSPNGDVLLAQVVDESPIDVLYVSDPTYPEQAPREHRYPKAGRANARWSLLAVTPLSGREMEIAWDRQAFEYLVSVSWSGFGAPLVTLANREQTRLETFVVDPVSGCSIASDTWNW